MSRCGNIRKRIDAVLSPLITVGANIFGVTEHIGNDVLTETDHFQSKVLLKNQRRHNEKLGKEPLIDVFQMNPNSNGRCLQEKV